MEFFRVDFEPMGLRARGAAGASLLDVAREAGIGLVSVCGGEGRCGRCMVRVMEGNVSPLTDTERSRLDAAKIADGYRLACLTHLLGNVKIDVPQTSRTLAQRLELAGADIIVPFEPAVQEHLVALSAPTLDDPRADWTLLANELERRTGRKPNHIDLPALRRLPAILREHGWRTRASLFGDEVIDVRPPDRSPLGLAIDVGTTKVAVYLVDMETGQTITLDGITNPQIAYGEDVMSRISYAMNDGGPTLARAIVEGINDLIVRICPDFQRVVEMVVVGNTAMHHLFLGLPVRQLGLSPFSAAVSDPVNVKARDLGLRAAEGANVHLLPNVAGFIGADHIAMILATGLDRTEKTVIGLDIGTNTEVVLARRGALCSCSTASGPAFEGAHIRHGMRAVPGAIDTVRMHAFGVRISTINDAPPLGICGSGVLDAIEALLGAGVLNRKGRLQPGPGVRSAEGGGREYLLVAAERSGNGLDITLSERDINEIILAKAAIRTGIDALLQQAGLLASDLDEIVIAGAFGTHISVASAIGIGMLPALPLERIKQVGNAAGVGARLALVSAAQRARAVEIGHRVQYLELTSQPNFEDRFIQQLRLPQPGA